MFSDNGTNMVGTHNELTCAFPHRAIEWVFNPPHASHHGGLWERMIGTVRRFLVVILSPNARLADETLYTVLCESENIVNSRTLTKCSVDASDDNHFLVLSGNFSLPWANVSEEMFQRRWRYAQALVNYFWKRWIREYLPPTKHKTKMVTTLAMTLIFEFSRSYVILTIC